LVPVIVLLFHLVLLILFSIGVLFLEVKEKGFFTWTRNSFGILFEKLVFLTCVLITLIKLHHYLEHDMTLATNSDEESIITVFKPVFVLSILIALRVPNKSFNTL